MAGIPRLLPLVAVAIGGVIAINVVGGAPQLIGAAKAVAEEVVSPKGKDSKPAVSSTATLAGDPAQAKPATPAPACAPSAAELAKEAGLSPAELQVLQSLGARRGQLDQREEGLDTQVQLIAAAEAKLDARIQEMNGLKSDIQGLVTQADQQQQAETDRLIVVYEKMKAVDAAGRITLMSDSVRLPMAAKMKPAKLADILSKMPAEDAKNLTEKLAHRLDAAKSVLAAKTALNPPAAPPPTQTAQNAVTPPDASASDSSAPPAAAKHRAKAKPKALASAKKGTNVAAADTAASGDTSAKPAAKSG
jgi:flagellar motility protein MotE (MotC chaperone)